MAGASAIPGVVPGSPGHTRFPLALGCPEDDGSNFLARQSAIAPPAPATACLVAGRVATRLVRSPSGSGQPLCNPGDSVRPIKMGRLARRAAARGRDGGAFWRIGQAGTIRRADEMVPGLHERTAQLRY